MNIHTFVSYLGEVPKAVGVLIPRPQFVMLPPPSPALGADSFSFRATTTLYYPFQCVRLKGSYLLQNTAKIVNLTSLKYIFQFRA